MYNLFTQRTFSDKFSFTFQWVRDNWRPLFKFLTIFMLPLSLPEAFGLTGMLSGMTEGMDPWADNYDHVAYLSMGLFYLLNFVSGFICTALLLSLFRTSFIEGIDIHELTLSDVFKGMIKTAGPLLLAAIVYFLVIGVLAATAITPVSLSSWLLLLTLPLFFVFVIAFMPFVPMYVLTDEPILKAVKHSLTLGFKCWGGFLAMIFVVGLLSNVIQGFGAVPFYICILLKAFLINDTSSSFADYGGLMYFINYLSSVLMIYISFAVSTLTLLAICVQYGHAADKVDGISADTEVDSFDK